MSFIAILNPHQPKLENNKVSSTIKTLLKIDSIFHKITKRVQSCDKMGNYKKTSEQKL